MGITLNVVSVFTDLDTCAVRDIIPANTTHRSNVVPMLGQRRRRWANIGTTLDRCVVFAGMLVQHYRRWANLNSVVTGPSLDVRL